MRASPKIEPSAPVKRSLPITEDMADPLHPMHQDLLRRCSHPPQWDEGEITAKWSRSGRMAALFYMGLGSWAIVGGAAYAVARLISRM